ncbi:MAG: AI-2E family transporter [Candidatus Cyclobacteriaceae bacterium M2_1C_046]
MSKFNLRISSGIVILVFGIIALLYYAYPLLMPLAWGIFFATLMLPVSNKLESMGMGRIFSSTISTLIVFIGITGLVYIVIWRSGDFVNRIPEMQEQFEKILSHLKNIAANNLGITEEKFSNTIKGSGERLKKGIQLAGETFAANLATTSLHFLLVMVYLYLLLLKRDKYESFILKYFDSEKEKTKAKEVTEKTVKVAGEYLSGRLKVMTILGILYIIAFLTFGLKNALLFTVIGTLLTVIPYVGPFLSGLLPIAAALLSGMALPVFIAFAIIVMIIQLIESYVLEPAILGSEVHLSPITILIAIIAGELLWGISGMILFVPIFAVLRIIFAEIDGLKPIAFLLGSDRPPKPSWRDKIKSLLRSEN